MIQDCRNRQLSRKKKVRSRSRCYCTNDSLIAVPNALSFLSSKDPHLDRRILYMYDPPYAVNTSYSHPRSTSCLLISLPPRTRPSLHSSSARTYLRPTKIGQPNARLILSTAMHLPLLPASFLHPEEDTSAGKLRWRRNRIVVPCEIRVRAPTLRCARPLRSFLSYPEWRLEASRYHTAHGSLNHYVWRAARRGVACAALSTTLQRRLLGFAAPRRETWNNGRSAPCPLPPFPNNAT
ncbi:hypothetical protein C8R43DRAFT_39856 [Mycena crocata]|nr:hypothetical protein C8R43DRAFT_39856 [Mycena crocata]